MRSDDLRFLVAFDRWATARVLASLVGIDAATWSAPNEIDERGLGAILVHHLGATQRWRHGLSGGDEDTLPRPEREPLPGIDDLRARWDREWAAWDAWLPALGEAELAQAFDGVPMWQLLSHVVNHGTQHRSEAAALLTTAGHSPGDLDMVFFAEDRAAAASGSDVSAG
ncbi:MAG: DinB family protein [Candidatus Limnocylindrales bacterium]